MNTKEKQSIITKLKSEFAGRSAMEIIRASYDYFGDKLAVTSAFGYSGMVLLHHIWKLKLDIPIFFIDTGFHFEETIKLMKKIKSEWELNINVISSKYSEKELKEILGEKAYESNPDMCCDYRKVRPLETILKDYDAWLSAIRKDQSITRKNIDVVALQKSGIIKISPFYEWDKDMSWMYIRRWDVPYNPLHEQKYPSIGCKPCTAPVDEGGSERSGRWKGKKKTECGLHK